MTVPNVITEEPRIPDSELAFEQAAADASHRTRRIFVAAGFGLVIIVAIGYFALRGHRSGAASAPAPDTAAPAATAVSTVAAVTREIPGSVRASGSFIAFETADVAPLVPGKVSETPVSEGRFVRRGDVLARLDDNDARLKVQQAEAAVRQAESAVKQARESLGMSAGAASPALVAEVESAKAQWQLADANERRYRNLLQSGDVAQAQYDEFKARADTAQKAYETALARARSGWATVDVQESALASAVAARDIARKALADTVIVAPLDGFVAERPTAVGEWVTTASRIATIVQNDRMKVLLQVAESDAARIRVGMSAAVRVDAFADRTFTGTVASIIPALDPAARALIAVLVVPNGEGLLKPGMFATADILDPTATVTGVVVPREAVVRTPSGSNVVYTIQGDTAVARVVQLGREMDGLVHIVDGLEAGTDVVTSGAGGLTDGAPIVRAAR